jgi:hypothetical protein
MEQQMGQIRLGGINYWDNKCEVDSYEGFTTIVVLTKSSPYGELGPYELRDEKGRIMENIWQFSKVYSKVPEVAVPYTAKYPRIVWRWKEEVHLDENEEPTDEYWIWREAGMMNKDPVRYPVGKKPLNDFKFILQDRGGPKLDEKQALQDIYVPTYIKLVKKQEKFKELRKRLWEGENLLIIAADAPAWCVGKPHLMKVEKLHNGECFRLGFSYGMCLAKALVEPAE